MNHNGGFPPIYEGGKKEVIQREFSAQNVLSLNQILNTSSTTSSNYIMKRVQPVTYNIIDQEPKFKKQNR